MLISRPTRVFNRLPRGLFGPQIIAPCQQRRNGDGDETGTEPHSLSAMPRTSSRRAGVLDRLVVRVAVAKARPGGAASRRRISSAKGRANGEGSRNLIPVAKIQDERNCYCYSKERASMQRHSQSQAHWKVRAAILTLFAVFATRRKTFRFSRSRRGPLRQNTRKNWMRSKRLRQHK